VELYSYSIEQQALGPNEVLGVPYNPPRLIALGQIQQFILAGSGGHGDAINVEDGVLS